MLCDLTAAFEFLCLRELLSTELRERVRVNLKCSLMLSFKLRNISIHYVVVNNLWMPIQF